MTGNSHHFNEKTLHWSYSLLFCEERFFSFVIIPFSRTIHNTRSRYIKKAHGFIPIHTRHHCNLWKPEIIAKLFVCLQSTCQWNNVFYFQNVSCHLYWMELKSKRFLTETLWRHITIGVLSCMAQNWKSLRLNKHKFNESIDVMRAI